MLEEDGLTLSELLVTSAILVVLVLAMFGLYRVAATEQTRVEGRVKGTVGQKNGLERMSRELRQSIQVCQSSASCGATFTGSSSIEFQRRTTGGTTVWVRFNCSGSPAQAVPPNVTTRACLRSQASTQAALGSNQAAVVTDVSISPSGIFGYDATRKYVSVSLNVSLRGQSNPLALQDGVQLRNSS